MTMPFSARDAKELEGLKPGTMIDFTLVVEKDSSYAEAIHVHRYQGLEPDPLAARFRNLLGRDLVLLTVTFDPEHDLPKVLAKYAQIWKADPRAWHFLTGSATDVRRVCALSLVIRV